MQSFQRFLNCKFLLGENQMAKLQLNTLDFDNMGVFNGTRLTGFYG